ncbi:hypothetical protein [Siccirubricoccus phaeus]|uniref:hypothetical protein n=1 Tax=Siccirubricoccus phaeus TaxID=2595053 RepID=UPI0011F20B29|nr:hypothetical protein [Siccirubricoccus phaeus]
MEVLPVTTPRLALVVRGTFLFLCLLLTDCANRPGDCAFGWALPECLPGTPGARNYQLRQEKAAEEARARAQAAQAEDIDACTSFGHALGSPEHAACRERLAIARRSGGQQVPR